MQHGDKIKVGYNKELTFDAEIYCVNCGKRGAWEGGGAEFEDGWVDDFYCPHCLSYFYADSAPSECEENDRILELLKHPIKDIEAMEFEPPPYVEPPEWMKEAITHHFETMQKNLLMGFDNIPKKGCRVIFPNLRDNNLKSTNNISQGDTI